MTLSQDLAMAKKIAQKVAQLSPQGDAPAPRAYFVGGYVRDLLMNRQTKDIDLEIHGVFPAQLEEILDSLGQRLCVGQSFGVYGLKGYSIDIAMPRKEQLRGSGHRDFAICVDPFIGTRKAAQRRDFTINAMLQDVLTGEIVDLFGGRRDLQNGVIRHVCDASFAEDPLRVLRAAQFAARFGFTLAQPTAELCKSMDLSHLAGQRVEAELKKALLQSARPSVFFETLRRTQQLDVWFSQLNALIGIKQNPKFHAEGDVWTHTMAVLDAAVPYQKLTACPFGFMLAAVTHDFGKALCTCLVNGQLHAYGHETEGLAPARQFLNRITNECGLTQYVLNLIQLHMKPNTTAAANAGVKTTNRMFDQAMDPAALVCLALADGEGTQNAFSGADNAEFLWHRLSVYRQTMARPYVAGKDLIAAGLAPGPSFSALLEFAHKLRLAGIDKDDALRQTLAYARKVEKKT